MKKYATLFIFLLVAGFSFSQSEDLETFLKKIPDARVKKLEPPKGYVSAYEIFFKQPLNHDHPEKGSFYQKVYLSHKSENALTVLDVRGYAAKKILIAELSQFLSANQIQVEHRYFGESVPDPLNYEHLRLSQVAADLHHIKEVLGKYYSGKWISSGRSKGGATVTYYRYFFPDDVKATVTYVAPIIHGVEDKRIYAFLDTVGSARCRKRLKDYQVRMLKNREEILHYAKWFARGAKMKFTRLSIEEALEYAILETPFSFWQHGLKEEDIPDENVPLEKAAEYIINEEYIGFYSDENTIASYPIHYTHAREMGYYGYDIAPFKHLLKALPVTKNPLAIFTPNKMNVEYDSTLVTNTCAWLESKGNNFIHVYGNRDTWTACAIPVSKKTNSVWVHMSGKHHKNANIENMNAAERKLFVETLEKWLEMKLEIK